MINLFIQYAAEASLLLRFAALIISAFFVIPLMIQQSKVQNGLRKLRYLLLILGAIIFIINLVTLIYLCQIIIDDIPQRLLNSTLQIMNAVGHLVIALITYMMYHSQYSKEEVKFHSDMMKLASKTTSKLTNGSKKN